MSNRGLSGGTPFERLLKKQCQKGVAANKSVVAGKFGNSSFTPIRNFNGINKPKKFFKSRAPEPVVEEDTEQRYYSGKGLEPLSEITPIVPSKRPHVPSESSDNLAAKPAKRNKFFTSKKKVEEQEVKVVEQEPVKVPPLKLRLKTSQIQPQISGKNLASEKAKYKLVHSDSSESQSSEMSSESQSNGDDVDDIISHSEEEKPLEQQNPLSSDKEVTNNGTELYSRHDWMEAKPDQVPDSSLESSYRIESKVVVSEDKDNVLTVERTAKISRLKGDSQVEDIKQKSKDVLNQDWNNDDEDDPEISFKDESLVLSPKEAKSTENLKDLVLQKAATISTAVNLEKELQLSKSSKDSNSSCSQPLNQERDSSQQTTFTKKRSIFKSKNANSNNKKALSLYKHKFHNEKDEFKEEVLKRAVFGSSTASESGFDFDDDNFGAPETTDMSFTASKLSRVPSLPANPKLNETNMEVVSVKCPKQQKEYYTVIKNVKKAHQIQDSGEFQEFNDDVEYILEGLGSKNSLSTRCLSTVTLASKCMEAGFRMHLRAHGTVTKFFSELRDSPQNASLALCASTVLFVLSQDRLNMDLDRDSLELMLNLLDTDSRIRDALDGSGMNRKELEKNKQKVQDLVAEMKKKGHAVNLSLDQISADHLSMETLLSLTSKRAGEWFKEELRELGGLDHLVQTMSDCVNFLTCEEIDNWTENLQSKLKKADRVLKVLENVTHENEENCLYLLRYNNGIFLDLIHKLFKLLDEEVPMNPNFDSLDKESVAFTLRESLFDCMRVYINLVHDYHNLSFGSELAGKKTDLMDIILHTLFILPESIPIEKRFDVHVLALTLLINLVENCVQNRNLLMNSRMPESAASILSSLGREEATKGLIKMFIEKEENARNEESKTDNILDGVKDEEEAEQEDEKKSKEERIEETVAKLLHKAGRHMEDTLIGSYITLVIGYLIINDKESEKAIREFLPQKNFSLMVTVLKKFFNFMNLTASSTVTSHRGIKATEMVIKHLEFIDKPPEELKKIESLKKEQEEENFDDLTIFDMTKESDVSSTLIDDSCNSEFGKL